MSNPPLTRSEALAARGRMLRKLPVAERKEDVSGVTTSFLIGGDGPPLVLLHGQGGSAIAWLPVLDRLLARHRVVVPDLPGLGESVVMDNELDGSGVANWLGELITKTCDEPPTIVGLSLGGSIAAHFGVRQGAPCRQIVLVDSGSLAPFRPNPRLIPAMIRVSIRPTERNIERFFRHTAVDVDGIKSRMGDDWPDFIGYGRERNTNPSVHAVNRRLLRRIGTKQIPLPELRRIDCTVALIWGREDKVMKVGIAEEASSNLGWPLNVLDDCGHSAPWDQPEVFTETLERLMAS